MSGEQNVFAVGRGQYENIGDIILRRPLLNWARESGRLHVYVGDSPEGYDEGLGLGGDDVIYRSLSKWYVALLRSALKGEASSIYKPGEIQLTMVGMKEHVAMLPAATLIRLRGGSVSRVGVGTRNFAPIPRAIMWPSNALSTYTRWRDDRTAEYFGFGSVMPDLGYVEGLPDAELAASTDDPTRDVMVISLRDDTDVAPRPYPTQEWFDGISTFAEQQGLEIWVVTQVQVDDQRSHRVAEHLDANLIGWPVGEGHAAQEERLRALYRRARVAASDRLHVVIAAFTEGAAPIGLQLWGADKEEKMARHFDTIGITGNAVNTAGMPSSELVDNLTRITASRADMLGKLLVARERLARVRTELTAQLRKTPAAVGQASVHVG